ncbi:MAG: hypothetical protein IKO74_06745 [Selenomonadaceae bacterium]|nr:hypothetical protein [Selenomonadaceae bacterium]
MEALNEKNWRPFSIEEIFDILPGKRLTKAEMISGDFDGAVGKLKMNNERSK